MFNFRKLFSILMLLVSNLALSANICVPDNSPGACDSTQATIELAVTNAIAGDTITLAVGNFDTAAQVVIDKNLTLTGAGSANSIINLSFDTGTAGDARGWFLVNPAVVFNINNVALDGTGQLIYQGIRHRGSGNVDNVAFSNIQYNASGPNYQGVAIAAFGDGITSVTNSSFEAIGRIGVLYFGTGINGSVFDSNTYMGKGVGDFLDYGLDISAGADITVSNNRIENNFGIASVDGSVSAGALVSTFFAAGTTTNFVSNTFVNSSNGIIVGFDGADTSTVTAYCNVIIGNTTNGIGSSAPTVDARENWWGCNAGPNNVGCDTTGGTVNFTEWLLLALTPGVTEMNIGDPATTLTADLTGDSGGGLSTGAPFNCTVPDGTQMNFDGGALGTVSPTTVPTTNGIAVSNFTPVSAGTANDITVTTNDGGETISTQIIILSADVSISKTLAETAPYNSGQTLNYSIDINNSGPNDATDVTVFDTPTNITITSINVVGGVTDCTNLTLVSGCLVGEGVVGTLASGDTVTLNITATIDSDGMFDNGIIVSSNEFDSNLANNTDNTGNGGSTAVVELAIDKSLAESAPFLSGQILNYTIVVNNTGPDNATNVTVTDTPSNMNLTSVNVTGGVTDCTAATLLTGCQVGEAVIGTLAVGDSVTLDITATIVTSGFFDNIVSVDSTEQDSNAGNNVDNNGNGGAAEAIPVPTLSQWLLYILISLILLVTFINTRSKDRSLNHSK
jgi:uncharacterized repeat protein (TIGR01451 family)